MKIRPPIKWYGGKHYLCSDIISHFPPHRTYVEPFGGAASILLNKSPADVEVYNDINDRVVRLFRVLRDNGEVFRNRLVLTPYNESEFNECTLESSNAIDEIEAARRDFVCWRQSFNGSGRGFAYSTHTRRNMSLQVSGWLSAIDEQLPIIIDRLRSVQCLCRPAIDVIRRFDSPDTLFYCDPPYVRSTRDSGSRDVYEYEMSDEQHIELAGVLKSVSGKVVLSGYDNDIYNEAYSDWRKIEIKINVNASVNSSKSERREMLWLNWHDDESTDSDIWAT